MDLDTAKQLQEVLLSQLREAIKESTSKLKDDISDNVSDNVQKLADNISNVEEKLADGMLNLEEKLMENISDNITSVKEELSGSVVKLSDGIINLEDKLFHNVNKLSENMSRLEVDFKNDLKLMEEKSDKQMFEVQDRMNKLERYVQGKVNNVSICSLDGTNEIARVKVKPPTFDGKVPWSIYKKQFEAAAVANGWSEQDKAISLVVGLRGEALNILQTIPTNQQDNYEILTARLQMKYGDAHLQQVYHAQIKNRCQRGNETLQEFEADVARLVRLAYPTAPDTFLEQLAVQTFVDGIRDTEIQQSIRLARPKTVDDDLAHALEIEAAKQASQRGNNRLRQLTDDTNK